MISDARRIVITTGTQRSGNMTIKCKTESEKMVSDIEKLKPCINYEDGCEEWAGCPCVYYKAEAKQESGGRRC